VCVCVVGGEGGGALTLHAVLVGTILHISD
jgi:hypothetical protein